MRPMWNPNESMFAGCVVLKAQDGLSPSSRRPRSRQRGRPLLSSQAAQPFLRYAHQTGDEEANGGEGQPRVDGVGGLVGVFPDAGVGQRLARPLREARAEQVTVDGFKLPAEEGGPGGEDALAEQGLDAEHHGEQQRDPQSPAQDDLAVVRLLGGFKETDADEAEGE